MNQNISIIADANGRSKNPLSQYRKEFISRLTADSQFSRDKWDAFEEFCEVAALWAHQMPYHAGDLAPDEDFNRIEAQFSEATKDFSPEKQARFNEMIWIVGMALHEHECDFMGEIFHELGVEDKGQSFTPFDASLLVARFALDPGLPGTLRDKLLKALKQQKVATFSDEACGAGGLLLAIAAQFAREGIDPTGCLIFEGTDIDRRAFNMAFLQLSCAGLMAEIRWGDSLSGEIKERRKTPQLKFFDEWVRQIRREQAIKASMDLLCPTPQQMSLPLHYEAGARLDLREQPKPPLAEQ